MILVNFKSYRETWGDGSVVLAKICEKVGREKGVEIIPVVAAIDLRNIKREVKGVKVFVQHVDDVSEGAKTGYVMAEQCWLAGADGVVINHSEHRLKPGRILKMLKKWPKGLISVVCVQTLGQTERWAKGIKSDMVGYEPKELIGNKEKSVTSEKPEMIKKIVLAYKQPVIVGAGIRTREDVLTAIRLGAKGILVSSGVIKAGDPEKELSDLADGFVNSV